LILTDSSYLGGRLGWPRRAESGRGPLRSKKRQVTNGTFSAPPPGVILSRMSTGTGYSKLRCAQCEMSEEHCECDKFCVLCQSQLDIRICKDGLMYCEPCRTSCDYHTSG
jgi:hypothetical protein